LKCDLKIYLHIVVYYFVIFIPWCALLLPLVSSRFIYLSTGGLEAEEPVGILGNLRTLQFYTGLIQIGTGYRNLAFGAVRVTLNLKTMLIQAAIRLNLIKLQISDLFKIMGFQDIRKFNFLTITLSGGLM